MKSKISSQELRSLYHNLSRALGFVWDSGPKWMMANISIFLIQGTIPLIALYLIKLVIDALTEALAHPTPTAAFEDISWLIMGAGVLGLIVAIIGIFGTFVQRAQTRAVSDHMHSILHTKSVEVDLEYYENPEYFNTLHRAQQAASVRPQAILSAILGIGQNTIAFVAVMGLLIWLEWMIIPILLLATLPEILVRIHFAGKMHSWEHAHTPKERESGYLNILMTRDWYAKEIRLFNLGGLFKQQFQDIRNSLRQQRLTLDLHRSIAEMGSQFSAIVGVFGILGFVAYQTLQGLLTIGDLVMYFGAIQRGGSIIKGLAGGITQLYENNLFISHLYEFLEVQKAIPEPQLPQSVPIPIQKGLSFEKVKFTYPNGYRDIFEEINFSIKPGEHIALVGENGAGKTTLIKLLTRLYEPTEGRITIDGIDIRDIATLNLRQHMSVVLQDYAKFYLTVRENIWLGNTDLPSDGPGIIEAAQQAGADGAINKLPKGFDTMLGKWFDGGEELSIGEWQKVALARAFFRQAQIIILDEPTSAMDAKAEYELFQRFHELVKGKMAIFISHRLSTVKMADRIFMLEEGRIIESGSHQELMELNGQYAGLFSLQAKHYQREPSPPLPSWQTN